MAFLLFIDATYYCISRMLAKVTVNLVSIPPRNIISSVWCEKDEQLLKHQANMGSFTQGKTGTLSKTKVKDTIITCGITIWIRWI